MSRILFISRYAYPDGPGGGQVSGRLLALAVAGQGHSVRFACMRESITQPQSEVDGPMTVIRYPYRRWRHFRRFSNLYLTFRELERILVKEIQSFKPDLVHFLNFDSFIFGAQHCKHLGIPCVATVNGPAFFCATLDGVHNDGSPCTACTRKFRDCVALWGPVRGLAYYAYASLLFPHLRRIYTMIDRFQVVSTPLMAGLRSMGVLDHKMVLIQNPVALMNTPMKGVIEGVPANNFILLYAGRVCADKNLQQVVRALALLPEQVMFVVVGTGDYQSRLLQLARELGVEQRVRFVGQVDHQFIGRYIRHADVIVAPSLFLEPFSRLVIEGMSYGKPSIVSDRGGNPEAVLDGRRGFVVNPFDVKGFASRVTYLLHNPTAAKRMGAAARVWATTELSSKVIGKKLCSMYAEVLR